MNNQNIKDYIKRYQKAHDGEYPRCLSCGTEIKDANCAAAWHKGKLNLLCPKCWEEELHGTAN